MTRISYNTLGDSLFVNYTVGGVPQQVVLPNTKSMRETLDRVVDKRDADIDKQGS